jgi:hypothetical protein
MLRNVAGLKTPGIDARGRGIKGVGAKPVLENAIQPVRAAAAEVVRDKEPDRRSLGKRDPVPAGGNDLDRSVESIPNFGLICGFLVFTLKAVNGRNGRLFGLGKLTQDGKRT